MELFLFLFFIFKLKRMKVGVTAWWVDLEDALILLPALKTSDFISNKQLFSLSLSHTQMAPPFVFPQTLTSLEEDNDSDYTRLTVQNPILISSLSPRELEEFVKGQF